MRRITLIIIHCSATPEGRSLDFETCRNDHIRHRGFRDIGYHFYITRDGTIHPGRPLEQVGASATKADCPEKENPPTRGPSHRKGRCLPCCAK